MVGILTKNKRALLDYYVRAKGWISDSQYAAEVDWQSSICNAEFSETDFLREYAWVVLNSGFRENIVRKSFNYIPLCYCDWESAEEIVAHEQMCIHSAYLVFKNRRKLEAIAFAARLIERKGFSWLKCNIRKEPIVTLKAMPFIGPVTAFHLAKNIGVNVAKPDRHLMRLAKQFGYDDVNRMCRDIEDALGDQVAVADIILWRFEERAKSINATRL